MSLFGTAGIRGPIRQEVTPSLAVAVGRAMATEAEEVVVGRDGRTTGAGLADAVSAGLMAGGADVLRAGMMPTPAVAHAAERRHGVMLTASHNPPPDNGIKLFDDGVEFDRDAERRIEDRVATSPTPTEWDGWGDTKTVDVLDTYRRAVRAYVIQQSIAPDHPIDTTAAMADELGDSATPDADRDDRPAESVGTQPAVIVDCGNGVGALATPWVLRDIGVSVTAVNANVDGHFPARDPKPTPESLGDLRSLLANGDWDLGLAHDGDADRLVCLDPDGAVVHEDTVVAVLAEHYVRSSQTGDPVVVTTPNASDRIDERVAKAGGRVERVRLGALHEGIAECRRKGGKETEVVFAAEPWKHIHPSFGGWIDGIVSAGVLVSLTLQAGGIDELVGPVDERPYRKVSVACPEQHKERAMQTITEKLPEAFPEAAISTDHGVRLTLSKGGWILVRPSGTEPYVRVYAESDSVDDIVAVTKEIVESAVYSQEG